MIYRVYPKSLKPVRDYLIKQDLEFHKDFEMNFNLVTSFQGYHRLEFFNQEDCLAFELALGDKVEKSNN